MRSVSKDHGVQVGLTLTGVLLAAAVAFYAVLFGFATRQVLQLDLRHIDPLTGIEYFGAERQPDGNVRPVHIRSVLDIRNVPASVAESHHRDRVTASEFRSSTLPDLIIASEDRRFYRHAGVDFMATAPRLLRGKGASTITMQLARSTALQTLAFPVFRKPYEWALAAALEQNLTKELILLDYANSIYVGKIKNTSGRVINMDGIGTAAYHLFGKHDLRSLSLAESATIVALFPAPNALLGAALNGDTLPLVKARNSVLRKLAAVNPMKYKQIANRTAEEPLLVRPVESDVDPRDASEAYFFDSLFHDRETKFTRTARVGTTLDPVLQKFAAEALSKELAALSAARGLDLNGAMVALDPQNGAVRALVGGVDRRKSALNRAYAKYSPGSAVKPFVYADAFERGGSGDVPFTPAYALDLNEGSIDGWMPADHITGIILPRTGLSASSNRAALVVANMIGMTSACETERLALSSAGPCSAQMLLGGGQSSGVTPIAMAEAYAAFANGGNRVTARFTDDAEVRFRRLFSAEAAFVTVQLLRSVIGDSPAVQATFADGKHLAGLSPAGELAGKTGSTDTTLWIAVVHPRLIVVVAVGTDDNQKLDGLYGASVAGLVWAQFVREGLSAAPWYFTGQFARPEGVVQLRFDPKRDCITETGAAREFFLANRRPPHCQ